MKGLLRALGFVFLAAACVGTARADTTWDLDAGFTYNNTSNLATGTIVLNSSLQLVSWDVTVSGTNTLADNIYTSGDSLAIFPNLTHLDFYDGTTGQYIDLYLSSAFSNAGGTINLLAGDNGADSNSTVVCAGCGVLTSGDLVGTPVGAATPEPPSVALFGTGAALLAFLAMRRRQLLSRVF